MTPAYADGSSWVCSTTVSVAIPGGGYRADLKAFGVGVERRGMYDLVTSLLPFVLFLGFWLFLMQRFRCRRCSKSDAGEAGGDPAGARADSRGATEAELLNRGQ